MVVKKKMLVTLFKRTIDLWLYHFIEALLLSSFLGVRFSLDIAHEDGKVHFSKIMLSIPVILATLRGRFF